MSDPVDTSVRCPACGGVGFYLTYMPARPAFLWRRARKAQLKLYCTRCGMESFREPGTVLATRSARVDEV